MSPRVVLIHNFLAPFRELLFEELARRFDLEVWILGDVRVIREWDIAPEEMPFPCRRLPGWTIGLGSRYNALLLNYSLPWELIQSDADAVICCGWDSPAAFYTGLWARLSNRPLLVWSGSTAHESSIVRTLTKPVVRSLVRSASAWLTDGTRAAEYLVSLGATRARVFPAFNSVDNAFYALESQLDNETKDAMRSQWRIGGGPIVLHVGNLLALKGVFDLVEAFARLVQAREDAHLVLVGSGAAESELRSSCQALGIADRVVFTGFLNAEQIARWYGMADLFVLASHSEIWGFVINEALASGLPVLASDACGAVADLVQDGVNGYVVPTGDVDALAHAMIRHFDAPETHEKMSAAAQSQIASTTFEAAADAFERAVDAALERKGQSPR